MRGVGARRGPALVGDGDRILRRQPPVVLLVEAHPVGVADHQAGVRLPPPGERLPGQLQRLAQRRLLRLVHAQVPQEAEDGLVAPVVLGELVVAAARQVVEQPGVLEGLRHRRSPEGVQHRRQLPKIAEEEELDLGVQGQLRDVGPEAGVQLRDLLDDQAVQLAAPVPDAPADEAVRGLGAGAEVLHGAVRLGDELDHLPELAELRHDLARQVRLAGAGHAREEQALPVEAVQEGVLHGAPLRGEGGQVGRLDAGLPVLALQALALLEAVYRCFRAVSSRTAGRNFLGRSWKTRQSVFRATT